MHTLTIQQQIEVLEETKTFLLFSEDKGFKAKHGMCYYMEYAIYSLKGKPIKCIMYKELSQAIPLFTKENAKEFGAHPEYIFWWPIAEIENRVKFIDWMIETLKKELK